MDDRWEKRIRPILPDLVAVLDPHALSDSLFSKHLVTQEEYHSLLDSSGTPKRDRACSLLVNFLPRKGKEAFDRFLDVLGSTDGQEHIAKMLKVPDDRTFAEVDGGDDTLKLLEASSGRESSTTEEGYERPQPAPTRYSEPPAVFGTSIERKDLVYDKRNDFIQGGGFGAVYKAKFTQLNETVAVKVFFTRPRNEDEKEYLKKEANVFFRIPPHLNIVKFIGICNEFEYYALVLEFVEGGNLLHFLKSDKSKDWKTRENVAQQIAIGMKHLHTCKTPVIHLDLKPENILIQNTNEHLVAKICDFGLAKNEDVSALTRSRQPDDDPSGTVPYIAPERYSEHPYGEGTDEDRLVIAMKSDVYSYGVVLWRIQEGRNLPTRKMPPGYYKYHKLPNRVQNAPKWYSDLVEQCDKEKPEDRPLFTEIVSLFESQP